MIQLTVRTLDSQNHPFTVEDDITVEQFKAHIAETVNIPADTQRIIYCGRVLNDSSKLSDYDVNGKVVHLVQRAPPSQNQRPRAASPQRQRRGGMFRTLEHGNAMYLGSMAFPSDLMGSQGFVPPPPTQSLAGGRLSVAKRMLRKAESVIRRLERRLDNTSDQTPPESDQTPPEESQEEEVTPVIEARVIVPGSTNEPLDEAMVLSVVENSLYNSGSVPITREENSAQGSSVEGSSSSQTNQPTASSSGTSTPRGGSSTENSEARPQGTSENNGNGLSENASRTSEMAELLTTLRKLQTRFAPFLDRYHKFMQEDPVVPPENVRQTHMMLARVSEVMHFFSHAYHCLSDIIVGVRTPPPRPLLCRPILIQHSAVVHAGIPIQVEAQINLSTERPPIVAPPSSTTTTTGSDTAATTATTAAESTTNSSTGAANADRLQTGAAPAIGIPAGAFPFIPMRMQSFPLEIRTVTRHGNSTNARTQANSTTTEAGDTAPTSTATQAGAVPSAPRPPTAASGPEGAGQNFNANNPNVEFFMEVTPDGITIDSMDTAIVGSNHADLLRGALNPLPPELLQSLMQVAGHFMDRPPRATTTATSTVNSSTESSTAQSSVGASQSAASGQNSQARGNTATNPTTATHTRSTPRPHVHLAQQAMQAGFDPFLPCNSHHVARSYVIDPAAPAAAGRTENGSRPGPGVQMRPQNIYDFITDMIGTIRHVQTRRGSSSTNAEQPAAARPTSQVTAAPTQPSASASASSRPAPPPAEGANNPLQTFFSNFPGVQNLSDLVGRQGPTIHQILQQFQDDETYVQGESLITDLIMLLFRNLTLVDLCAINSNNYEPIRRCRSDIQSFVRTRILQNNLSPEGVDEGAERLIVEMRPFLQNFRSMPTYEDIDVMGSLENFLRAQLPRLLYLMANLTPENVEDLMSETIRNLRLMCALTIHMCSAGQQGVERVLEQMLQTYLDVPPEVQHWTFLSSRVHLRQFLSNIDMPEDIMVPFIRRNRRNVPAPAETNHIPEVSHNNVAQPEAAPEAMELDDEQNTAAAPTPNPIEDPEPLRNLVLGSEAWHAQVPPDWVPIIAKDAQKQRRQNAQGPFSDAYLSGMPSKRRKIVNNSKPQGSLPQVISESVRQAVNSTGLTSAAPLESVVQAASESIEIQTAYRNLFRSSVQANLRDNEDFTAERYPNASNYFNNPQ